MAISNFYYHPRMLAYDFGPKHPLRPERLRRAIDLVESFIGPVSQDPGFIDPALLERVHSPEYIAAIQSLPQGLARFGLGPGDNPAFPGMWEASLAYVSGSARAALELDGKEGARTYNIAGGLHHARRDRAAGFCIFNDVALAAHLLLDRFDRVATVDIDVHHGEGTQYAFVDEPRVLTCSIHQNGRTLFPGTGFPEDHGPHFSAINVPLAPETGTETWLWAFEQTILPALEQFEPSALVLQLGTDAHFQDPLARLRVRTNEWLSAVRQLHTFGLPTVVLGGGGYSLMEVPRMWTGAILTLSGHDLPETYTRDWGTGTFLDPVYPFQPDAGHEAASQVVEFLRHHVLERIPS